MVVDSDEAVQWLDAVGYYRLSGYWYPYRRLSGHPDAMRDDDFIEGTAFSDVVRLYEFDRKLRTLIHDGIERIEVALRSRLAARLGEIDPLAYESGANFRPSFEHERWLEVARQRIERSSNHSESIRHYKEKYAGQVPIWVLSEVLDFADISKLYDGLDARSQWRIAEELGVDLDVSSLSPNQQRKVKRNHPLARWLEQLTILRNACAHHARVWNRRFIPAATAGLRTIDVLESLPMEQSERLYGACALMAHLLQTTSPGSSWAAKVRSLVEGEFGQVSMRNSGEMGFPEEWSAQDLWMPTSHMGLADMGKSVATAAMTSDVSSN